MRAELAYPDALSRRIADPVIGEALAKMQLAAIDMAEQQIAELERMKKVGMRIVDQIDRTLRGKPCLDDKTLFGRNSQGICGNFVMVARVIRQIDILLEELRGFRPPLRGREWEEREEHLAKIQSRVSETARRRYSHGLHDGIADYYDYRPMGQTVDWIRLTLAIAPPAVDLFKAEPEPPPDPEPEIIAQEPASPKRVRVSHVPAQEFPGEKPESDTVDETTPSARRTKPPRGPP